MGCTNSVDVHQQNISENCPKVIFVTGPPGSGKTT